MTEQIKQIPSKGTRLWTMLILELFASVLLLIALIAGSDSVTFAAWAEFTKWNVGTYAASETFVKGAEGVMNRDARPQV